MRPTIPLPSCRCRSRRCRVPAIHIGFDVHAQGRHGDARQSAGESRNDPHGDEQHRAVDQRRMGAAVPRHGSDDGRDAAAVSRRHVGADGAGGLHAAAAELAAHDPSVSRGADQRSELRLRSLRQPLSCRPDGGSRSVVLEARPERRGTGARRYDRALHRDIRAVRLRPRHDVPRLRTGGSHVAGRRRRSRPGIIHPPCQPRGTATRRSR